MSSRREELLQRVMLAGRELSTAAVMFHTAVAAKGGLTATETKALDLLDRFGPLTAGELAERSGLAPASVTGLVDRLEHKGVARRVPHPQDRRRVLIEMNRSYLAQGAPLFDEFVAGLQALCAKYTDEQLETVVGFITESTKIQQDATAKLTAS
ncbi:MAG TPA: MarR family transcriptional regulator [Pseudonocardiaceae bacterium]|jgi:DNA-binding MarR family transcriptional regulator|nr:MarR family transcriptional regulator [Pseudonocardiaceae bacterium]